MSYLPPAERASEDDGRRRRRRAPRPRRPRRCPRTQRRGGRRRGRRRQHEDGGERWLLTYADMITLLMALFMVLFSISSVNISKYPGPAAVAESGLLGQHPARAAKRSPSRARAANAQPRALRLDMQLRSSRSRRQHAAGLQAAATQRARAAPRAPRRARQPRPQHEQSSVRAHQARARRLRRQRTASPEDVQTTIEKRGLVIRVLTDDLLFASGQATLTPARDLAAERDRAAC